MYNTLKELKITDRIVNEDNDYLLQEEYDKILNIHRAYSILDKVIKEFERYCEDKIRRYAKEGYKSIPCWIKIISPAKYDVSNCNDVTFCMSLYPQGSRGYRLSNFEVQEKDFKLNYIADLYQALNVLEKTNYVKKKTSYYSDYITFSFDSEYDNKIQKAIEEMKNVANLVEYFKDKIVHVEEDKKLLKELQEIDDFLENL